MSSAIPAPCSAASRCSRAASDAVPSFARARRVVAFSNALAVLSNSASALRMSSIAGDFAFIARTLSNVRPSASICTLSSPYFNRKSLRWRLVNVGGLVVAFICVPLSMPLLDSRQHLIPTLAGDPFLLVSRLFYASIETGEHIFVAGRRAARLPANVRELQDDCAHVHCPWASSRSSTAATALAIRARSRLVSPAKNGSFASAAFRTWQPRSALYTGPSSVV